jgi:long-chain acyl-CoA synthetase
LADLFDKGVAQVRRADGLCKCMGKSITYEELEEFSSASLPATCRVSSKLAKGARVALMMPNCLQYPVAMFANVARLAVTVVNVNPLYTARELEHQLSDAGCEAIVIVENFAHTLAGSDGRHVGR